MKTGDVVYLSEDLIDNIEVVKCHTWSNKTRVDVVVARSDIMVPSETVSNLNNQPQTTERVT